MTQKAVDAGLVEKHFDSLAASYDTIKKEKNSYYYRSLMRVICEIIPKGKKVLDIGTGTGEILNALSPSKGTGIDLSPAMIKIAAAKYPHLCFFSGSFENIDAGNDFDYILLADVIEHLESPEDLFLNLKKFCHNDTEIILTMANPFWEPVLHVLEKLKLKMDEGPHHRISEQELLAYASKNGFTVKSSGAFVLLPVYIPLVSAFLNEWAGKLPLLKRLALIKRYVFRIS